MPEPQEQQTDAWLSAPPAPSRPPAPLEELLRPVTHAQGGGL